MVIHQTPLDKICTPEHPFDRGALKHCLAKFSLKVEGASLSIGSLEYFHNVDDTNVLWSRLSPLCAINNVVGIAVGVFACIVVPPWIRIVGTTLTPTRWANTLEK